MTISHEEIDCVALYRSVLAVAIEDLTTWATKGKGNGGACWQDVQEARRLLTDEDGEWAESREILCGIAGYDPDRLRVVVLRALKTGEIFRRSDFTGEGTNSSGV